MVRHLFIDVETFSSVDIQSCGAYKYIESPDFEILIIGYAFDDEDVQTVDLLSGEQMPEEFEEALLDSDVIKVAHNAVFERLCFKRIGYDIPAREWYCTLVKTAYCGLPLSLGQVSDVLQLKQGKLETGKMLIKYFSCPCKATITNGHRTRNYPEHAPDKWKMYKEYNVYDVLAEREIFHRLEAYEIPKIERRMYVLDQDINDRGILIDTELAQSAIYVDETYSAKLIKRAKEITSIENPNSPVQIKKWVERRTNQAVRSLSKEFLDDLADEFDGFPDVQELLAIRSQLSKTSIKKYYAMINCAMADNRVRGTFQFYGANRTGRWAGRLLQLQNLSKNHVSNIEVPRELVRNRDVEAVEMLYDNVADILSQLVRTALIAPEGKMFSVADFSAIEARVVSWIADEKWRMDVFRGDGKIYEATGSKMFGVPMSAITKGSVLRDKSKISELALGYGGSVEALKRMGGLRMGLSAAEMADLVRKWRFANKSIVDMWSDIESAAIESIKYHRKVRCTEKPVFTDCDGEYLTIQLPSKRMLFYNKPRIHNIYKGSRLNPVETICYQGLIQTTKQWGETDTYGGKLTENIVQAISRDLLGNSMLQLDEAGFHPVCHIHDECLVEVPAENAQQQYDEMVRIMSTPPDWASDLPLRADGYVTPFYLKD